MKKRIFSIIMAFCLAFSLIPTAVFADDSTTTISATKTTVVAGDTFDVSLAIPSINTKASTASFKYTFNNEIFEVVTFSAPTITGGTLTGNSDGSSSFISCTYEGTNGENTIDLSAGLTITATFKVKEGTQNGSYDFTVDSTHTYVQSLAADGYTSTDLVTIPNNLKTTVTVSSSGGEGDGYTAALSSTTTSVTNGETVSVTVTVGGTYNAAELTLSYPSDILNYTEISTTSNEVTVDSTTTVGKLYIVDKGDENTAGTYTLNFTSKAAGNGNVTLDAAAFGTRADSQTSNLTAATVTGSPLSVTVNPKTFAVVFPDDANVTGGKLFATNQTPTQGTDFLFTAANNNYTYSNVVVKVGADAQSATEVTISGNQASGWTVPGASITGNIYVTATATPNTHAVKYSYVDVNDQPQAGTDGTATYGTAYTYTMPTGVAAEGATDGFHYEVDTVTIGGHNSTDYAQNIADRTVIITKTAITGEIVITLKKVTDLADYWAVSVEAKNETTAAEYSVNSSVKKDDPIALTIIPQAGYEYTVTAKNTADGATVELTKEDNVYTTKNGVTENITFVIVRTVTTDNVFSVELYLEGGMGTGNQNMYLVLMSTNLGTKHYTCDGKAMFWSEKYNANCYLVIADTAPAAADLTFTIADGAATAVSYDMDVNESTNGTVDANDAQLAYDMYNKEYKVATENVTIYKFLKADVAGDDYKLDVNDAAAIVTAVLTRMNAN